MLSKNYTAAFTAIVSNALMLIGSAQYTNAAEHHRLADQLESCLTLYVKDGDTVKALCETKGTVDIRLYCIDAPEKNQVMGRASTAHLKSMIEGAEFKADLSTKDRYGRYIGSLYQLDGVLINEKMVEDGMAHVYTRYCPKGSGESYYRAEEKAQTHLRGVWAGEGDPVKPWDYRRKNISQGW